MHKKRYHNKPETKEILQEAANEDTTVKIKVEIPNDTEDMPGIITAEESRMNKEVKEEPEEELIKGPDGSSGDQNNHQLFYNPPLGNSFLQRKLKF